jgi:hypothetical protein
MRILRLQAVRQRLALQAGGRWFEPGTAHWPVFGTPGEWRDTARAMSQENVDLIRQNTELWLRGDFERWFEILDPEVGWDISTHPLPDVPNRGQGREA